MTIIHCTDRGSGGWGGNNSWGWQLEAVIQWLTHLHALLHLHKMPGHSITITKIKNWSRIKIRFNFNSVYFYNSINSFTMSALHILFLYNF